MSAYLIFREDDFDHEPGQGAPLRPALAEHVGTAQVMEAARALAKALKLRITVQIHSNGQGIAFDQAGRTVLAWLDPLDAYVRMYNLIAQTVEDKER